MKPTEPLPVRLYGQQIATLHRTGSTTLGLEWNREHSARVGSTLLSGSLRFGHDVDDQAVADFFGGYLPEGTGLDSLAGEVGVSTFDVFGMLEHVGADLPGALIVGTGRDAHDPEPLHADELPGLLDRAAGYATGGGGSALPGFQRKLTLTRKDGRWWKGNGTWPTTHILKPAPERLPIIVRAEAWVLDLSRTVGLTTFDSHLEQVDGRTVLVIERYDRTIAGDGIATRMHQEDAAQALGLPWRGEEKFEQQNSGATLDAIADLLDRDRPVTARDEPDRLQLLRYVTLGLAVGNTDAHAKNYSILRPRTGRARLAPLYDTVPLSLLPDGRQQLALRINGCVWGGWATTTDLVDEAHAWGIHRATAAAAVADTLDRLGAAAETVNTPDADIDALRRTVLTRIETLQAGEPTDPTAGGIFNPPITGFGSPIDWTHREARRPAKQYTARPGRVPRSN